MTTPRLLFEIDMLSIEFVNDLTGTQESANYSYAVAVNGDVVDSGRVENHDRGHGWKALVYQMLFRDLIDGEREYQLLDFILRSTPRERQERIALHILGDEWVKKE